MHYAKPFTSEQENIVYELYLEILKRPPDQGGLYYYSTHLLQGGMTKEDVKFSLLDSDQGRSMLRLDESRPIIENMYKEILSRPPTNAEIENYQILYKMGRISMEEIELELLNQIE